MERRGNGWRRALRRGWPARGSGGRNRKWCWLVEPEVENSDSKRNPEVRDLLPPRGLERRRDSAKGCGPSLDCFGIPCETRPAGFEGSADSPRVASRCLGFAAL